MKKYLAIVLSAVFVLGLAATAFAINAEIPSETQAVVAKGTTQVTLGGSIRVRGESRINTADFNSDADDRQANYDQRVRLSVDAKVADNVSGSVMLETGANNSDMYTWGSGNAATGAYAKGNSKAGTLSLVEGWFQYKGKVGVKVGHMPLALGNKLFFDHTKFGDDAIVLFMDPAEGIHVGVLTAKFVEGSTTGDDDANAYVALATYKSAAFNAGADLTIVSDQNFIAAPLGVNMQLQNLGLRGDMNVGPAAIKADIELQSGTAEKIGATGADLKFSGTAIQLGASMKLDPVTVGLELGIGSGDKGTTGDKYEGFITSLSSVIPYIGFVYATRTRSADGTANSGIANTTYVKATAGGKAGDIGYNAALIFLQATEVAAGAKDDIGTEIDATVTYNLAKNLKYWVEGGYLMAGDFYKVGTKDPDAAYALRHGIELTF